MSEQKQHTVARNVAAVSALVLLIIVGTLSYHWLENWTWIQSFYFTVSSLATVGYGDMHPTTDSARLFTALFILTGVGIAVAALSVIGSNYIENRTNRIKKENRTINLIP